jgi:hypothetical protein
MLNVPAFDLVAAERYLHVYSDLDAATAGVFDTLCG